MSNVTHETLRQLKAQDIPTDSWDMIVVHILHEKLDGETSRQWELARESETPTVSEMLKFLDHQAASLMMARVEIAPRVNRHNIPERRERDPDRAQRHRSIERIPCNICSRPGHPVWECDRLLSASLQGRREIIARYDLCTNCLKKGHRPDSCYQGPCVRCQGRPKHNSLICPKRVATNMSVNARFVGKRGGDA